MSDNDRAMPQAAALAGSAPSQSSLSRPSAPAAIAGNRFRRSPSALACIHRFEAAYQHSCDIEMKAREAIAAFRETEQKWENRK